MFNHLEFTLWCTYVHIILCICKTCAYFFLLYPRNELYIVYYLFVMRDSLTEATISKKKIDYFSMEIMHSTYLFVLVERITKKKIFNVLFSVNRFVYVENY
jgi:hypothetical protein